MDRLLTDARAGHSGVLVLRGEAGIGKSTLLEYAAATVGTLTMRGSGIETESELPFAGLHLLLSRFLDRIDSLPTRQGQALGGALGLAPAGEGDRFMIGLAVLTLLADIAEEQPLVCLIDDAHWLDRASADALLFAARRLQEESIALIFAVRDRHAPAFPTPGLPELQLGGLDATAAAELLTDSAADLPHHVRAHILNESAGNPLALLELAAARREGRLPAPHGLGLAGPHSRVQQSFADRIAGLPGRTQDLLLVAAADDSGDAALVLEAAGRLGAAIEDLQPAEHKELIQYTGGRLAFRHPLIRAAAYQNAPLGRRMAAHKALADSLAEEADEDRRVWHLAAISMGPDEQVAAALERSAEHARALGGFAAVAAAYERAAALSPETDGRGRRLLAAAVAATDAGMLDRGAALAVDASAHLDDPLSNAQAAAIRATLADEQMRPTSAHHLLVEAGSDVAALSPGTADYLFFRSVDSALVACDLTLVAETARRVATLSSEGAASGYARFAIGLGGATDAEVADAVTALRELTAPDRTDHLRLREQPVGVFFHEALANDRIAVATAEVLVQNCRDRGAIGVLPLALTVLARAQRHLGHLHLARATAAEGLRIAHDTGQSLSAILLINILADIAAIEGDETACRDALSELVPSRALDSVVVACSLNLLDLGLARYEEVLARREVIVSGANRIYTLFCLPDIVEAATRVGLDADAADAHACFRTWAEHTKEPWAQGVALRCTALLDDADAERHFAAAVAQHRHGGRPFERARTELLFGEWLRRNRRRAEARAPLRTALEIFQRLNAHPWTARAQAELRASGEMTVSSDREPALIGRLTPQELQVVRLAATGMTNRNIGTHLFLSPRTVGFHLSNAYPKLGVGSRGDLRGMTFEQVT